MQTTRHTRAFRWVALPRFPGRLFESTKQMCLYWGVGTPLLTLVKYGIRTNPTRPSPFVWIFGSFFISANESAFLRAFFAE